MKSTEVSLSRFSLFMNLFVAAPGAPRNRRRRARRSAAELAA